MGNPRGFLEVERKEAGAKRRGLGLQRRVVDVRAPAERCAVHAVGRERRPQHGSDSWRAAACSVHEVEVVAVFHGSGEAVVAGLGRIHASIVPPSVVTATDCIEGLRYDVEALDRPRCWLP